MLAHLKKLQIWWRRAPLIGIIWERNVHCLGKSTKARDFTEFRYTHIPFSRWCLRSNQGWLRIGDPSRRLLLHLLQGGDVFLLLPHHHRDLNCTFPTIVNDVRLLLKRNSLQWLVPLQSPLLLQDWSRAGVGSWRRAGGSSKAALCCHCSLLRLTWGGAWRREPAGFRFVCQSRRHNSSALFAALPPSLLLLLPSPLFLLLLLRLLCLLLLCLLLLLCVDCVPALLQTQLVCPGNVELHCFKKRCNSNLCGSVHCSGGLCGLVLKPENVSLRLCLCVCVCVFVYLCLCICVCVGWG